MKLHEAPWPHSLTPGRPRPRPVLAQCTHGKFSHPSRSFAHTLPSPLPAPRAETLSPGVVAAVLELATSLDTVVVPVHAAPTAKGLKALAKQLNNHNFLGALDIIELCASMTTERWGLGEEG
jgi:hypothetical protein